MHFERHREAVSLLEKILKSHHSFMQTPRGVNPLAQVDTPDSAPDTGAL